MAAMAMPGHDGTIAGFFAGQRVLAGCHVHQGMEKEQMLRHRRQQAPPQVTALQMDRSIKAENGAVAKLPRCAISWIAPHAPDARLPSQKTA